MSPNMSRPIGGSSSRRTNMDEDEAEGSIPEPMTPPGCGQGSNRSRSPLPRYRIPRAHSPREEGVQLVEIRTPNSSEVLEMHYTQPVQMIKLLMAFPDMAQMTRLSYKHIVLAGHSRIQGLDDPAWLALEYKTGNNVGCHCHWVLERSRLLLAARNRFNNRCRVHDGPIEQDQTLPFMRFKRQTDLAFALPCGRVGTLDFRRESRSLQCVQEKIQERFAGQFHGELPRLQVLCDCGLHFTQLRIDAELMPGKDMCVLAMTGAWNKTQALVPELQYKDCMVPKPVAAPPTKEMDESPSQKAKAGPKVQQKRMPRPAQRQATGAEAGPVLRPKSAAPTRVETSATTRTAAEEDTSPAEEFVSGAEPIPPPVPRDDTLKEPLRHIFNQLADSVDNDVEAPDSPEVPRVDTTRPCQSELEDAEENETPVQKMHRFVAEGVRVSFRLNDTRRDLQGTKTVTQLVHMVYLGMNTHNLRLILDGKDVGPMDVVTLFPPTADSQMGKWIQLHINPKPGLRGGAPDKSEDEIRSVLSSLLQSKGLKGKDLQQKLEETFARIPRQDLQGWVTKGTWQALKQTVGTRITFLSRQRKEQDPWEESDPWSQALSSKDPKPSGKTQLAPPQIVLIPQVWENEDKTTPSVIERPTRGSTGLAIMSP